MPSPSPAKWIKSFHAINTGPQQTKGREDVRLPQPRPVIRANQQRRIAADTIMGVLASAGRLVETNPGELTIRPKLIHCHTKVRRLLADAIYGKTFPRVMAGEFFHTTGVEGFLGIAESGELRLYTLRKRMECPIEGEFYNLAALEGWRGADVEYEYPEVERPGTDLFYLSLIEAREGADLWDFGPVRLRLRIDTSGRMGQLRTIQYHDENHVTLLGRINKAREDKGLPPILPETSHRTSAYSLPPRFKDEIEVRLLHMHLRGLPDLRRNDGHWDYWPVPIGGQSDVASISLLGIDVRTDKALGKVRKALEGSTLADVPVAEVASDAAGG